jgi:hypothetical protein
MRSGQNVRKNSRGGMAVGSGNALCRHAMHICQAMQGTGPPGGVGSHGLQGLWVYSVRRRDVSEIYYDALAIGCGAGCER